jgi:hypothetical protein
MTGYPLGARVAHGFDMFMQFFIHAYLVPLLLPLIVLVSRPQRGTTLPLALFGAQVAYSIYVGGDVWDWWGGANRFISIAMPVFFVLYAHALQRLVDGATSRLRATFMRPQLGVLLALLSLVSFNSLRGTESLRQWLLLEPPLHRADNENMIRRARLVTELADPEASIAVTWAGAIPYFTNRTTVDLLGKNDRVIAHQAAKPDPMDGGRAEFLPGHMKRDYDHSLGRLQPDVIVQLWKSAQEASMYLNRYYLVTQLGPFTFSLRTNSPHIRWDQVARLQRELE